MTLNMAPKMLKLQSLFVFIIAFGTLLPGFRLSMATLGGLREVHGFQNSRDIEDLGKFAVEQYNSKENAALSFNRVVKAQEQVVSGTMYHLTIEGNEGNEPKLYKAKVWVKPWQNHKSLEDFQPAESPSLTSADLGSKKEEALSGSGWKSVPVNDPLVKEAADHAVQNIQKRSNSLAAYELQEVLAARAEVWVVLNRNSCFNMFDFFFSTHK
eukprot:TRINITY_DN8_c0_g1_i1.p1 TRINITY_DN8_c0_g1~~TRINITY_DN8_c0_g1_i1.p1  ORF type:complete len:212 (+),score=37.70 TRINITY_DN8_c0_g1_i1:69-704(+)